MTEPTLPSFWQEITDTYRDGLAHAFIVHGNIRDYTQKTPFVPLMRFLGAGLLQSKRDLVITINPASGIDIPFPAHRSILKQVLSLDSAPKTPLANVLRSIEELDPHRPTMAVAPIPRTDATLSLGEMSNLLDWLLNYAITVTDAHGALTIVKPDDTTGRPLRVGVLIDFADFLLPDTEIARIDVRILTRFIQWGQSLFVGQNHILIMVCESLISLHSELRRASARWQAIELRLPDFQQRLDFIINRWDRFEIAQDYFTPSDLAHLTGALSLIAIEDILLRGASRGLSRSMVTERKSAAIRSEYGDVIEVLEPRWDFSHLGGSDHVKTWFTTAIQQPWQRSRLRVSGILMSGPPGNGKTMMAEAFAGVLGVPFVVFRLSKILGQYVGNSERSLERVITSITSLAPAVVFIDELDQVLQRGNNPQSGSEVSNRLFARILEWLADPDRIGHVLVIAATNRPDLIDPALASRFDRRIPILPPTDEERPSVILAQCTAQGIVVPSEAINTISASMLNWSGRNIRDFVGVAAELVDGGTPVQDCLQEAFAIYHAQTVDIEPLIQLAIADVSDKRLVPVRYHHLFASAQTKTIPLAESHRGHDDIVRGRRS